MHGLYLLGTEFFWLASFCSIYKKDPPFLILVYRNPLNLLMYKAFSRVQYTDCVRCSGSHVALSPGPGMASSDCSRKLPLMYISPPSSTYCTADVHIAFSSNYCPLMYISPLSSNYCPLMYISPPSSSYCTADVHITTL